ncbi:MAG TPA: LD-carboxypeptidase [Paraburkholderia sp.]|jgi:muramoyltetrapeptide carboxypeptidase
MHFKGRTVGVVAPAGIPDMTSVERSIALLESWGLDVRVGPHVTDRFRYFAGTHENRAADLAWALTDPAIDIVWIARGGYGCVHCLPTLPSKVPCHKTVVGYSDATALFSALGKMPDVRLIHGPTMHGLATKVDDESRHSILASLLDRQSEAISLQRLHGPQTPVSGPLNGGNITVLASIAGTKWQADCHGAIVLLEDITELAYRIDRSVTLLKQSGSFDGAAAFVLGEFVRCPLPADADFTLHDMLVDLLKPFDVPIFAGLAIGHGTRNLSWTYGAAARIDDDRLHVGSRRLFSA